MTLPNWHPKNENSQRWEKAWWEKKGTPGQGMKPRGRSPSQNFDVCNL